MEQSDASATLTRPVLPKDLEPVTLESIRAAESLASSSSSSSSLSSSSSSSKPRLTGYKRKLDSISEGAAAEKKQAGLPKITVTTVKAQHFNKDEKTISTSSSVSNKDSSKPRKHSSTADDSETETDEEATEGESDSGSDEEDVTMTAAD